MVSVISCNGILRRNCTSKKNRTCFAHYCSENQKVFQKLKNFKPRGARNIDQNNILNVIDQNNIMHVIDQNNIIVFIDNQRAIRMKVYQSW